MTESNLACQCLEITRLLTEGGSVFRISMKTKTLSFFASSSSPKGDENTRVIHKKKRSPATKQRSKKRKEEFVRKKRLEATTQLIHHIPSDLDTFDDIRVDNIPQYEGNDTVIEETRDRADLDSQLPGGKSRKNP